jgi:hypothetical protein
MTHDHNSALQIPAGETIEISMCCEKCHHVQKGEVHALEWPEPIPVSKRLPERGFNEDEQRLSSCSDFVLAWNGADWFICFEQDGVWEESGTCDKILGVTHWLPLPKPPC